MYKSCVENKVLCIDFKLVYMCEFLHAPSKDIYGYYSYYPHLYTKVLPKLYTPNTHTTSTVRVFVTLHPQVRGLF